MYRNRHFAELRVTLWTSLCHEVMQGYGIRLKIFGSKVSLNLKVTECAFIRVSCSCFSLPEGYEAK